MRSTTNPTALAIRRIDWRRERGRSSESALSRSDWVCWNVVQDCFSPVLVGRLLGGF